jgi:energy-coupling factor transport system ATP-binding protein
VKERFARHTGLMPGDRYRARGRLDPWELAEAAVLSDVALATCVAAWLLPGGFLLWPFTMVPTAVVVARHRLRAGVIGGLAVSLVGLMVGGVGLASNVLLFTMLGAAIGVARRRRWGVWRTLGFVTVTVWPVQTVITVGSLAALTGLRELALDNVLVGWRAAERALRALRLDALVPIGQHFIDWAVDHWWLALPLFQLGGALVMTALGRAVTRPVARRLSADEPPRAGGMPDHATPSPVPVRVVGVRHRWPGGETDALAGVDLVVAPGELVAVTGSNGSGKSTLARILGGTAPTAGRVERPGAAGLGRPGGTALVFQRPESQVLGNRVLDDVVWGLPPALAATVDVDALLERVGLAGFGPRDTSTLSGGELQRLAVAAALARRPRLVVSDEATAMLDRPGRRRLLALLRSVADEGVAVVHVTHHPDEAAAADRIVRLERGRVVTGVVPDERPLPPRSRPAGETGAAAIALRGLGHVYAAGTPWAHRALAGVDLDIAAGESVLLVGPNGSGKSTLAWVVAGLVVPTEGKVLVGGAPADTQVGTIALSFQHARLQLLRPTVAQDIAVGLDVDDEGVDAALAAVGLDRGFRDRSVDRLSGGELRRVALAGALVRRPAVLVLDEPFAGLDPAARVDLAWTLHDLRERSGTTLLVVSHDFDEAAPVTDRVVALAAGRVAHDGPIGPTDELESLAGLLAAEPA